MNTSYHPNLLYDISQARLEDLRREAAARRLAELAQGNRSSRIRSIFNNISAFSNHLNDKRADAAGAKSIKLRERQA